MDLVIHTSVSIEAVPCSLSSCRELALVDTWDLGSDLPGLEHEIDELEQTHRQMDVFQARVEASVSQITSEFDQMPEVRELLTKIYRLERELYAAQTGKPFPTDEERQKEVEAFARQRYEEAVAADRAYDQQQAQQSESRTRSEEADYDVEKAQRNENKELRRLWRKLAGKCHPDKTSDARLNALFVAGHQAYLDQDLDKLDQIVTTAFTKIKTVSNKQRRRELKKKQKQLRREVKIRREALDVFKGSVSYAIYRDVNSGLRGQALALYKSVLKEKAKAIQSELRFVRNPISLTEVFSVMFR